MSRIAWELSKDGKELDIYEIDSVTRRLHLILPLKRIVPMTPEEALKYVNDNYPPEGSAVRLAAETLGIVKRRGK